MLLCRNNINDLLGCVIIITINIIVSIKYYTCIYNYDVVKKIYKSFIISTLSLFDLLMNTFLDENIIYKH